MDDLDKAALVAGINAVVQGFEDTLKEHITAVNGHADTKIMAAYQALAGPAADIYARTTINLPWD